MLKIKNLEPFKIKNLFPGLVLFIIALVIGCFVCKDYGVSWDEPVQRELGHVTYNYVFNGDTTLKSYQFRGLGSGFELPLACVEKWFLPDDTGTVYFVRHLITHIFFLLAALCGYVLILHLFKSRFWACIGFILLVFHPRIYAHSFFNPKDIPFLSAFLITLFAAEVAFRKDKWYWYMIAGIAGGYATSIRAMGILLLACLLLFFAIDHFRKVSRKENVKLIAVNCAVFAAAFLVTLYAAWPLLWSAPFHYFAESFQGLANIKWEGKVLFEGHFYSADQLPWRYVPVWISISIPELLLASGFVGSIVLIVSIIRNPRSYFFNEPIRNFVLYLICFIVPASAMMLSHAPNIDDWRHLYFIYPCFVLLALFALSKVPAGKPQLIVKAVLVLQVVITGAFIVGNHPFEQVYFNNLVSHSEEYLRDNYELDYWGVGFKKGIEHLIRADHEGVKLSANLDALLDNNISVLKANEQELVQHGPKEAADYFITNFRYHPFDYPYKAEYTVSVLNSTVLAVYRLEKDTARRKQQSEEEIRIIEKYLSRRPNDDYAHGALISLFLKQARYDSAEVHAKKVFKMNPDNIAAANDLAKIFGLEKNYDASIDVFIYALEIKPNDAQAMMNIGVCYYRLRKYDSAIYYWKRLMSTDGGQLKAIENVATTYKFVGNADSAAKYEEMARILDPAFKLQ